MILKRENLCVIFPANLILDHEEIDAMSFHIFVIPLSLNSSRIYITKKSQREFHSMQVRTIFSYCSVKLTGAGRTRSERVTWEMTLECETVFQLRNKLIGVTFPMH